MKQLLALIFVCSLIIIACGDRTVGGPRVAPVTPSAKTSTPVTPASPLGNPAQAATTTATAATTAQLNPAHGQPGHRCDIAVGAPLPAANASTGVQQTTPTNNSALPASIQATPASTAALNPAHGLPNHRCDIPVGAPLDSKPASK